MKKTTNRLTRRTLLASAPAMLAWFPYATQAQVGGKAVQFILPFSAGSGVDGHMRAAQNELAKALGAPIVINNQPGAGGIIGTQQLVKAAPDGLTLGMISNNHVVYPSVLKSVPFDPVGDITAIAVIGSTPFVLVTNPKKIAAKSAAELTAHLKANPDKHNYGSSGNGTILHFGTAMYVDQAGVQATHIPYKGVGPLVTDLIGGQVDFGVVPFPAVAGHLRSGALHAVGVASAQRIKPAPDLPTFVEQGMPNMVVAGWFAVVGPAKLPVAEIARVHKAFSDAFASDEVKAAMDKQGTVISIMSTEQSATYLKSELAKYAALAKAIKLEVQ